MPLQAISAGVKRGGVALMAAAVLAAGCGGPPQVEPLDEPDQPVSSEPGVESGSSAQPEPAVEDASLAEFAGMYGWDPDGGFHDAVWFGTLVIDGACASIDVIQDGEPVQAPRLGLLRSFLRLPGPLTRYDTGSGALWVGDHGPMYAGDEVVVVGSEGWQLDWNDNEQDGVHDFQSQCPALLSFWAASMRQGTEDQTDAASEVSQELTLAGLYLYDFDQLTHDAEAFGVLVVEPPCIYINELDPSGRTIRMPDGQLDRTFVRLPQALVRFDADTNSIWVRNEGPLTTGDEVTLGGGYTAEAFGKRVFEEACSANGRFTASGMTIGFDHMLPFGWDDPPVEPRHLTNMFDWDPDGGYHDASVSGILEIVPACTYVTDELFIGCVAIEPDPGTEPRCVYITSNEDGETALASDGTPIRTLLRLPRPLTSYAPDSGELWVGDHGPMTTGDQVTVAGSVGWIAGDAPREEPFEGRCAAHGSFWAASMQPSSSQPADVNTSGEQPPPLAGMFPWDPKQDFAWNALNGTLAIEAPCVYIKDMTSRQDLARTSSGEPMRLLLGLAQPLVRFDQGTGELWVGSDGPFADDDRVMLLGGPKANPGQDAALQVYKGGCSAHEVFWTLEVRADDQ